MQKIKKAKYTLGRFKGLDSIGVREVTIMKNILNRIFAHFSNVSPIMIFLAIAVLMVGVISLASYFNRPVSDDYFFSQLTSQKNPIAYAIEGYTHGNGRLGQYFVFAINYLTFGLDRAVILVPIFNTLALVLVVYFLVDTLISRIKLRSVKKTEILLISVLTSICVVFSARSIFDSSFWLDSSVSYLPSLIFLILNFTLIIRILWIHRIKTTQVVLLLISVLVGQQFSEPTSLMVIVMFGIISFYLLVKRSWKTFFVSTSALIVSILGLMVIYFSPGSQARRVNYESALNFKAMLIDSLNYFNFAFENLFSWKIVLFFALAIFASIVLKNYHLNKKSISLALLSGAALITIPYYILFVVSEYSLPGYIALRTYQVPSALSAVGIVIIITIVILLIKNLINKKYRNIYFNGLALVGFVVFILFSYNPLGTFVKAQAIRSVQYDYRELSIQHQVIAGNTTIRVLPAPVLLSDAQPGEFLYRDEPQIDWFESSFKKYYNIEDKEIEIVNNQSSPYCLSDQSNPSWNISSCEDLSKSIYKYRYN